jgi:acetyl esterase/lipase
MTRFRLDTAAVLICCVLSSVFPASVNGTENPIVHKDIEYAVVDGHSLRLDLYLSKAKDAPLVIWIHGGGWKAGSKDRCFVSWLTDHGYSVASISYRLTDKAIFPAQIHDCKGAIRWLRAHANEYGYSTEKIAVAGSSAGGHLAALVGTSANVETLEGTVGGHLDQSSHVDAVVDFYGPTDFVLRGKSHPARANAKDSGTYGLLGGPTNEKTEMAKFASPTTYVSSDDPPVLAIHGDNDKKVYLEQSHRLQAEYQKVNRTFILHVVEGGGHGGKIYFQGKPKTALIEFLNNQLKPSSESP